MNPSLTRCFTDLSSVSGLQAGSSPIDWARGAVQVRGGILLGVAQLVHTLQRGPDDRMVSCEEQ